MDANSLSIAELQTQWASWQPDQAWTAEHYLGLTQAAVNYGHYGLAREIADAALRHHPNHDSGHHRLVYQKALCLSRAYAQCVPLLEQLLAEPTLANDVKADVLALQGRLYKNQCIHSTGETSQQAAKRSASCYEAALASAATNDQAYFFAINAASMYLVAGDTSKSQTLATQALDFCQAEPVDDSDYWKLATLGEASVLLNDTEQSKHWYGKAHQAAGKHFGSIGSMRSQLQMLARERDVSSLLEHTLAVPKVAVFTGHMIDYPNAEPRFPAHAEPAVNEAINAALSQHDVQFGYGSAACGADILFAEQLAAKGAETNLYLPFAKDDFVETSVAYAGEQWCGRFEQALKQSTTLNFATQEHFMGDVVLFDYCNRLFEGAAILRARQMATQPILLTALNPSSVKKTGGSLATLEHWQSLGLPYDIIELDYNEPGPIAPRPAPTQAPETQPEESSSTLGQRHIHTMLFADVVGFSRLSETEAPVFVEQFLGSAAKLLHQFSPAPLFINTWGDGIYMVFDTLDAGAEFALQLRDLVRETDWPALGLPEETSIRIALHSGPVFPAVEPLTQRPNFFGSHVTRAARIEPVTVPGSVYLTEQAANILVSSANSPFQCDDLGAIELAKKYGAEHIYRLRRRGEWE